ncbi:hypothetical protein SPONN_853 [uncultured Candidatus Thioglobus sp.]|nr:hypothetical protein SPONN_853 [uncultured Candidatus Thioglobus sp.]
MVVVDFCDCWLFSFSLNNILPKKYWALLNVQSDIYLTNRFFNAVVSIFE